MAGVSSDSQSDLHSRSCEEIGGTYLISHCIAQLAAGGVKRIVIVTTKMGDRVEELARSTEFDGEAPLLEFVHLGQDWVGTFSQSIGACKANLSEEDSFLLTAADLIFEPDLISESISRSASIGEGNAARVVVVT